MNKPKIGKIYKETDRGEYVVINLVVPDRLDTGYEVQYTYLGKDSTLGKYAINLYSFNKEFTQVTEFQEW